MATYKVIQDIEAEDHILGPLTLKQFIFALMSVFFFYLSFIVISKGVAFVAIIFLPPALFFGFFAVPFGRDQPTEVWALAKLRFLVKPRRRIWDQSGVKELVTVTVPKKIEQPLTNGLSQYEVASRLTILANTLDTRGWSIKNIGAGSVYTPPTNNGPINSDRLVDIDTVPITDEAPDEADILDDTKPVSQHFKQMIDDSSRLRRQQLIDEMNSSDSNSQKVAATASDWFTPQTNIATPVATLDDSSNNQQETVNEAAIMSELKSKQQAQMLSSGNLRNLKTETVNPPQPIEPQQNSSPQLTGQPNPDILKLASSGDTFTVETISHVANKQSDDEVVIPLH